MSHSRSSQRPSLSPEACRSGLVAAAMGVTAAAAFGAPALAQDAGQPHALSEVTVIGRHVENEVASPRSTASVLNTPQTLQVIPVEIIEAQGARNLTDVLMNTPGITFNAGENGFATGLANFGIRGFDASGSIFTDGARDSGSYNRDTFNIEQVEVVKGPSADNGRGTAGGYVNIVTKTPQAGRALDSTLGYGFDEYDSDGRLRWTLDANEQITDTVGLRLNLLVEDGGVATRAVAERNTFGFAPSIAFGIGTPTRFTAAVQHVEQNDIPDWGIPAAALEGTLRYDPTIDTDAVRDAFYGLSTDFDDVTATSALFRFERDISDVFDLTAQLRWSNTDRTAAFTMPSGYAAAGQQVTTLRTGYARENEALSALVNLGAAFFTGSIQHRGAIGLDVSSEEASARAYATQNNPGTGATISILNPNPDRAGVFAGTPTEFSTVSVDTVALYAYDTLTLSPHWQVTGGLRLERYEVRIDSVNAAGTPTAANGLTTEETTFSGRIGAVYKPNALTSYYASYGVSSLPPASFLSNADISRGGDNAFPGYSAGMNSPDAGVQQSINYEIGGKWDLMNGALTATAALFRTERQDVAVTGRPTVTAPVELLGFGEQSVQGLELGLSGRITPQWSVFAGAVWLDSERSHDAALDLGRCRANPADYGAANAAACNATHAASGDRLAFTPEFSANVWTTYDFDFGLRLGGGVRYVGESFVGRPDDAERIIPNGISGVVPDYWVANALVEYDITPNVAVRLNVDNITDEFYVQSINWSAQRASIGVGRSFLLSLRYRL